MIRFSAKSLYLAAFLFLSFNSHAEDLITVHLVSGVTLRHAVAASSIVAKIQITSVSPVLDESLKEKPACGFLYGAKVIQSFKGGSDSFNFFMPSRVSLFSRGKDYLAIVKYRTNDEETLIFSNFDDVMSESDSYSAKCRFRSGFYVSANSPFVMPFDMDAGKEFGGQWLVTTPGLFLCEYKEEDPFENDSFSRKTKSGKSVHSWVEVKRLIKKSNRWFDLFRKNKLDSCIE
ncbi:hypothetical protein [Duganella phyllosphaerae]|uniref:Secreted protein n=1 Tax=Duganella phyllosphaerae TaxID=762836 RepID=A0A1E7WFF8_9BURK|nr:hypothetical protein [Duganella phyllosphaerae]OEZ97088.1 hypothetical protein DUPY_36690 [Duganella phyllosphaerae]